MDSTNGRINTNKGSSFIQHTFKKYCKKRLSVFGSNFLKLLNSFFNISCSIISWWTDLIRFYNLTWDILVGIVQGKLRTCSKWHSIVVSFDMSYLDCGLDMKLKLYPWIWFSREVTVWGLALWPLPTANTGIPNILLSYINLLWFLRCLLYYYI